MGRRDLLELIKDIGTGLLFVSLVLLGVMDNGGQMTVESWIWVVRVFYIGFCIGFALSFKDRILMRVNEFSLLSINAILLYYCIAGLGYNNSITLIISILTVRSIVILFKKELSSGNGRTLYHWYMLLFLTIVFKNLFVIWLDSNTSLFEYFIMGGFFLNIWIYISYLSGEFIDSGSLTKKAPTFHSLHLDKLFERTGYNIFITLGLMLLFIGILLFNFQHHYVSEGLLVTLILLFSNLHNYGLIHSRQKLYVQADNNLH